MHRMIMGACAASAFALAACSAGDPAEMKAFDSCQTAAAKMFPYTPTPGQAVDPQHTEDVGGYMESCMTGYAYKYDQSKSGCQSPSPDDPRAYLLKAKAECYSPASVK